MYLELLPFQIKIIESILQRQDIGIVAKASFLKNDPGLESKSLQNYLVNNEYETIGYCLVAPEKLIPVAKSALEWSNDELEYYLIKFQEKNESEMFGQIDLSLPKKLEYFLDLHTELNICKTPNRMIGKLFQNSQHFIILSGLSQILKPESII